MILMIDVIVIAGPTASGKTALSLELAKILDIEIISADSRQIYKYLDIGTAKPTNEELAKVKHHFIDIKLPDENYSAGIFGAEALNVCKEIHQRNKIPVVVGGSGLYIQALTDGFFEESNIDEEKKLYIRNEIQEKFEMFGRDYLYEELKKVDLVAANNYSDKNPRRLARALEYFQLTGQKFSENLNFLKQSELNPIIFGIDFERANLYRRINERVEIMWESGLVQEVQNLLSNGFSKEINSLNTVGYKEVFDFLDGKQNKVETIELIQRNTRRYAKRQLTWFRRINKIIWLNKSTEMNVKQIFELISNN